MPRGGDSVPQFEPRDPRGAFPGRQPGQGESELKAIGLGNRFWFPDEAARNRAVRYDRAERLLDVDEHYKLFSELGPAINPPCEEEWIPVDFPGMLARLTRHYTLGPDFSVRAKRTATDPEIQRIAREGRCAALLRQVAEALPIFGDAVVRVDVEEGETEDGDAIPQAVGKFVHPGNYHPEFAPTDPTKVVRVTLAWVFPRPESVQSTMPFVVLKEIHEPGQIRYEAVTWDGNKEGTDPVSPTVIDPELEDGPTGIDEIPVIHFGNNVAGGTHFGRSEFKRIERIFLALENRMSQEDEILERHARPKLIVGPGVLDPQARANLADFDVIEIDPSILEKAVKPEYLTWDPQIEAIKHQLEKLEEYFFITTETSPASFGLERDGSQVESARALRFKAHRTINKIEDLRDPFECSVRDLFRIAQKRELAAREEDGVDPYVRSAVDIHFPDPIIEDDTQEAQDYALMKTSGIVSRKRAVQDLHGLTPEEAEEEVREILQDQTDEATTAAPAPPLDAGGLPEEGEEVEPEGEVEEEV